MVGAPKGFFAHPVMVEAVFAMPSSNDSTRQARNRTSFGVEDTLKGSTGKWPDIHRKNIEKGSPLLEQLGGRSFDHLEEPPTARISSRRIFDVGGDLAAPERPIFHYGVRREADENIVRRQAW